MSKDIGPIPERRSLDTERHAALRRSLLKQFSAEQRRPLYKRPSSIAIGTTAAMALGTAVAATHMDSKYVPPPNSVLCYSKAEPGIEEDRPPVTMARAAAAGEQDPAVVHDVIDACALAWRTGSIAEGEDDPVSRGHSDPNENNFPVPALVACVLEDDSIGVFPGDSSTCRTLGLPVLATTQ